MYQAVVSLGDQLAGTHFSRRGETLAQPCLPSLAGRMNHGSLALPVLYTQSY